MQQYKEVKRQAKPHETILIVDAHPEIGNYKNGDIMRVVEASERGGSGVFATDKNNDLAMPNHSEYVVLEPIETPAPTISNGTLTIGTKSVKLTDEQLSALGMVTDTAKKRYEAIIELNEKLWRFSIKNGCHAEIEKTKYYYPGHFENFGWSCTGLDRRFFIGFKSRSTCRRAIDEIIIPYCKEHPELGL